MAVELNQKYENRKVDKDGNHKVASVVRIDETAKTCILQSDDGKAYGPMNFLTLKKSWKKLEDEVVEEVKEVVAEPEVVEEEKLADGTTYQQAMADILHDEKIAIEKAKKAKKDKKKEKPEKVEKAEKPKKTKKVDENYVDPYTVLIKVLDAKEIKYKHSGGSYIGVYEDKKVCLSIYHRRNAIRVYMAEEYFGKIKDYADLFEQKGPGTEKMEYSIYIKTENIEAACEKLF